MNPLRNFGVSALLAASMPMGGVRESHPAPRDMSRYTKFRQNKSKGRKSPSRGLAVPRDPGMVSYETHY